MRRAASPQIATPDAMAVLRLFFIGFQISMTPGVYGLMSALPINEIKIDLLSRSILTSHSDSVRHKGAARNYGELYKFRNVLTYQGARFLGQLL